MRSAAVFFAGLGSPCLAVTTATGHTVHLASISSDTPSVYTRCGRAWTDQATRAQIDWCGVCRKCRPDA